MCHLQEHEWMTNSVRNLRGRMTDGKNKMFAIFLFLLCIRCMWICFGNNVCEFVLNMMYVSVLEYAVCKYFEYDEGKHVLNMVCVNMFWIWCTWIYFEYNVMEYVLHILYVNVFCYAVAWIQFLTGKQSNDHHRTESNLIYAEMT